MFRLYQLSLTEGKVISAAAATAAAALCCLCIPFFRQTGWLQLSPGVCSCDTQDTSNDTHLWSPPTSAFKVNRFFFSQTFAFISTRCIFRVWFELLRYLIRVAVCSKRKKKTHIMEVLKINLWCSGVQILKKNIFPLLARQCLFTVVCESNRFFKPLSQWHGWKTAVTHAGLICQHSDIQL